jgi:protein CWC15
MSTASRPTFHAAVGTKSSYGGFRSRMFSAKDQAGHTKLKFRQLGQSTKNEIETRDLKNELELKEQQKLLGSSSDKNIISTIKVANNLPLLEYSSHDLKDVREKYDDTDADHEENAKDLDSSR